MVQDEFGEIDADNKAGFGTSKSANSSPLFERGRFYEEYAARRNERLKRKKSETGNGEKTPYNLGVTVESAKRRDSKKIQNLRKSVSAAYSVERSEPRYMLRSMSKENKKPPLPLNSERSVIGTTERKTAARRTRKLIWFFIFYFFTARVLLVFLLLGRRIEFEFAYGLFSVFLDILQYFYNHNQVTSVEFGGVP